MEIREFEPRFRGDFIDLFIETFTGSPWNENWTEEEVDRLLSRFAVKKGKLAYAALDRGNPEGFLLGYRFRRFFYLDQLFVERDMQNRGWGKMLMARLFEELKRRKVKYLFLLTRKDSPAYGFYEKRGFRPILGSVSIRGKIILFRIV